MTIKTNKTLRGFSIIELTIVIILIGLLSIAILTGTQLIKEAQIRSLIESITQYEKAVREFKVIYNYLPGDFPHVETWSEIDVAETCYRIDADGKVNGGDGSKMPDYELIRGVGSGNQNNTGDAAKKANCHLVLGGILPKQDNVGRGIFETIKTHTLTKREYTDSYFIDRINIIALADRYNTGNSIIFLGSQPQRIPPEKVFRYLPAQYAVAYHARIKSHILQAVDRKMDDGKPGDGKVIFGTGTGATVPSATSGNYPESGNLVQRGNNGYDSYEPFCSSQDNLGICTPDSTLSHPGSKNLNSAYMFYKPSWLSK